MAQEIVAALPGKVSAVNIKVGDKVEEDEEDLVIEAMKMETPSVPKTVLLMKLYR